MDAGEVLPEFTGTLMRDGYTGYAQPAGHYMISISQRKIKSTLRSRPLQ